MFLYYDAIFSQKYNENHLEKLRPIFKHNGLFWVSLGSMKTILKHLIAKPLMKILQQWKWLPLRICWWSQGSSLTDFCLYLLKFSVLVRNMEKCVNDVYFYTHEEVPDLSILKRKNCSCGSVTMCTLAYAHDTLAKWPTFLSKCPG